MLLRSLRFRRNLILFTLTSRCLARKIKEDKSVIENGGLVMLTDEPDHIFQTEPQVRDYTPLFISGAIILVIILVMLLFLIPISIVLFGDFPYAAFLPLLVDLGLTLLILLAGVLLLVRPAVVRTLPRRISALAARNAPTLTSQEASVWCFWLSAYFLFMDGFILYLNSGHHVSGWGYSVVMMVGLLGAVLGRELCLLWLRRRR